MSSRAAVLLVLTSLASLCGTSKGSNLRGTPVLNSRHTLLRLAPESSIVHRRPPTVLYESNFYAKAQDEDGFREPPPSASRDAASSSGIKSKLLASSSRFRFYLPLSIGTPGTKQLLNFNSLRSLSYVQERQCNPCFKHPNVLYSISASSTAKVVSCSSNLCTTSQCTSSNTCAFNSTVSGATFFGIVVSDTFKFTDASTNAAVSVKNVNFRAVRRSNGFDFADVDGIASFGPGAASLTNQFSAATGRAAFSICLSTLITPNNSSKLVIGKNAISPSKVAYTRLIKNPNYLGYHLQIRSIYVGGKKVGVPVSVYTFNARHPNRVTILESSYEVIGLTQPAYSRLTYMIRKRAKAKRLQRYQDVGTLSPCYVLKATSAATLNQYFPTIQIRFSLGATLHLAGYQYMYPLSENVVCSFIVPTGNVTILGALAFQNVLTVYDLPRSRVGFKPTNCARF